MNNYGMAHRVAYGHGALNKVQVVEDRHEHKGTGGHIKILVILVMFLLLMMIASIIIGVVSISHWNRKDGGQYDGYDKYENDKYKKYYYEHYGKSERPYGPPNSQTPVVVSTNVDASCKKDEIYTIAFGDDWGKHELTDEEQGCALRGWGLKIVLAACKAKGLICKTMYAPYDWCINFISKDDYMEHPRIGEGLLNKGITACSGWFPTAERSNVALFSDGYLRNPKVYLWRKNGGTTLTSSTRIGFIYSSPNEEKCLKRYLLDKQSSAANAINNVKAYSSMSALIGALDIDIDMAFINDLVDRSGDGLTKYDDNEYMICARGPAGLVANKRHKAFIEKWNVGLELIKGNGVMKAICDEYDDDEWCVDTYWV